MTCLLVDRGIIEIRHYLIVQAVLFSIASCCKSMTVAVKGLTCLKT